MCAKAKYCEEVAYVPVLSGPPTNHVVCLYNVIRWRQLWSGRGGHVGAIAIVVRGSRPNPYQGIRTSSHRPIFVVVVVVVVQGIKNP